MPLSILQQTNNNNKSTTKSHRRRSLLQRLQYSKKSTNQEENTTVNSYDDGSTVNLDASDKDLEALSSSSSSSYLTTATHSCWHRVEKHHSPQQQHVPPSCPNNTGVPSTIVRRVRFCENCTTVLGSTSPNNHHDNEESNPPSSIATGKATSKTSFRPRAQRKSWWLSSSQQQQRNRFSFLRKKNQKNNGNDNSNQDDDDDPFWYKEADYARFRQEAWHDAQELFLATPDNYHNAAIPNVPSLLIQAYRAFQEQSVSRHNAQKEHDGCTMVQQVWANVCTEIVLKNDCIQQPDDPDQNDYIFTNTTIVGLTAQFVQPEKEAAQRRQQLYVQRWNQLRRHHRHGLGDNDGVLLLPALLEPASRADTWYAILVAHLSWSSNLARSTTASSSSSSSIE